jgi:ribosomal protein S18 acetylase RimI-like enzyme
VTSARAFVPDAPRDDALRFHRVAEADLAFVYAIYSQVRAVELAPVPWPQGAKDAFLAEQAALQHRHYVTNYPGADLLVIEDATGPIGRVYVYRVPAEIRIMDIALMPDWRNRGIGTRLLNEILDEARATGSRVTLHVEPDNPAQRLYRRLGFRLIEHRGVYDFLGRDPVAPS